MLAAATAAAVEAAFAAFASDAVFSATLAAAAS